MGFVKFLVTFVKVFYAKIGEFIKPVPKQCKNTLPGTPGTPSNGGGKTVSPPGNINPIVTTFEIDTNDVFGQTNMFYFAKSSIVLILTRNSILYRSKDEGVSWLPIPFVKGYIVKLILHEFDNKRAYLFISKSGSSASEPGRPELWVTTDQFATAENFKQIKLTDDLQVAHWSLVESSLEFSFTSPDRLLVITATEACGSSGLNSDEGENNNKDGKGCFTHALVSDNAGSSWKKLDSWVYSCKFAKTLVFKPSSVSDSTVYCSSYKNKKGPHSMQYYHGKSSSINQLQLLKYDSSSKIMYEKDVVRFYIVSNLLVLATENQGLIKLFVSEDGVLLTESKFPHNVNVHSMVFSSNIAHEYLEDKRRWCFC